MSAPFVLGDKVRVMKSGDRFSGCIGEVCHIIPVAIQVQFGEETLQFGEKKHVRARKYFGPKDLRHENVILRLGDLVE